jgi:hypothetical protein
VDQRRVQQGTDEGFFFFFFFIGINEGRYIPCK